MKVAIIGAGRMGRRHVEACQRAGYSVVALADTKIDAAKEAAALAPGAVAFDSVDGLLGMSGIDVVAIATTTVSHCELAIAAMEAGVRLVLVEKPLGRSLAECDEVIAVSQRTDSRVAVNHPYRHMQHMRSLIELMRSEAFGGVSSMHIVGGNGGLAMLFTHFVDLFELAAGEPITTVRSTLPATISPNPRGEQYVDHSAFVVATTASGRRLVVDLGGTKSASQGTGMVMVGSGPFGIVDFDLIEGGFNVRLREPKDRSLRDTQYMFGQVTNEIPTTPIDIIDGTKNVLQALVEGGDYCTLAEARHYVETLIGAIDSHRASGLAIPLATHRFDREEQFPWP
ncbi:MAG: Gfo/Idh/MocA family protein [Ilumatobacteraceae bacterium]